MTERIKVRAGDSMPILGAVVQNHLGRAVDLTDAVAYLQVVTAGVINEIECTIADRAAGIVTYDWRTDEVAGWGKGVHDLRIRVAWDNGDALIAGGVDLVVGPYIGEPIAPVVPPVVFTGIYGGVPAAVGADTIYGGVPAAVGADTIYGGSP